MKITRHYHDNSDVVSFERKTHTDTTWEETTYNEDGNKLTYKDSSGYWEELTYDGAGCQLTYKDSNNEWWNRTYDDTGNEVSYKDSDGLFEIREVEVSHYEFNARVNNN